MIRRELLIFVVAGCLTVAFDFIVYRGLTYLFLCDSSLAKAASFIVGCIFAYFANRFWTFKRRIARSGSLWRFNLVYAVGLVPNVLSNQDILSSWDSPAVLHVAFLVATRVSATLNFMGKKWFVFNQRTFVSSI